MSFSGRSPFNDVVRSVIIGAAMIAPAALVACAESPPPPATPDTPMPVATGGTDVPPAPTATAPDAYASINDSGTPAPPDTVVRPRTPPGQQNFPTRGFSGAARARV